MVLCADTGDERGVGQLAIAAELLLEQVVSLSLVHRLPPPSGYQIFTISLSLLSHRCLSLPQAGEGSCIGASSCKASGAKSAPLGHTTVPHTGSTVTRAKYAGSWSGSNTGPLSSGRTSTVLR